MEQGQVQLRLIKDLLATGYDYMELHDFADAYRSAIREFHSSEPGNARAAWDSCSNAIGLLAMVRFGPLAWIKHLADTPEVLNLTITRE